MTRWIVLASLALCACGGGSGGSTVTPKTIANHADFGFWYTEPGQLDATTGPGKPVTIVFCQNDQPDPAEGANVLIQCAQEAQAHGVKHWIASVAPFLFDWPYRYRGATELGPLCEEFAQLGIMPTALYMLDEPDWHLGKSAATVIPKAAADMRQACPGPAIAAIYRRTTPGMQALDWVGFDDDTNAAEFAQQPQLFPGQKYLLVPYGSTGAAGWPMDPANAVAFVSSHAVAAVLAFAWASFGNLAGISVDGQGTTYLRAGCEITGVC